MKPAEIRKLLSQAKAEKKKWDKRAEEAHKQLVAMTRPNKPVFSTQAQRTRQRAYLDVLKEMTQVYSERFLILEDWLDSVKAEEGYIRDIERAEKKRTVEA